MLRTGLLLFFSTFILSLSAQHPAGQEYRSTQNELYWANRKPDAAYWQQDVHYRIRATVDTLEDKVGGSLVLDYWNNSPFPLTEVYFHLYQNAFQPGSYLDQLLETNRADRSWGKNESAKKGCMVSNVSYRANASAAPVAIEPVLDNSIMKLILPQPVPAGGHVVFEMKFDTWWDLSGEGRRRMKGTLVDVKPAEGPAYKVKHYDGVLWYPRICVYDMNKAWNTDQHLGKEFYGDFGSFDVELTFPGEYVVDGTGVLENENEVLPAELRKRLDVSNFSGKKWDEAASEIIPRGGPSKTWKFFAKNVHDFGFTADPTYRIGEEKWNGVRAISLAKECHASGWQDAAKIAARVIQIYSTDFGMYAWPKIIVADADDGMEYPMMTLDGGRSPSYTGLLAHEIGHMWFYGMLGSNETYRAFLDEGFTQFLTAWSMKKMTGDVKADKKGKIILQQEYVTAYLNYLRDAREGYDGFLNTHSHGFWSSMGHENGYGMVYRKTATMLYNLQYVLGDELFARAMQHYVSKWKICHPYANDFRQAITETAQTDLSWFFDQWLETDKRIDYSVACVKKKDAGKKVEICLKRKEDMQMPLDILIETKAGDSLRYIIPNTDFHKQTGGTAATILPKWTGWDNYNTCYTTTLELPAGFRRLTIDPSGRLADIYAPDNVSCGRPPRLIWSLYPKQASRYVLSDRYSMNIRPNLWWNGYSGLQAGASVSGDFARYSGRMFGGIWLSTGLGYLHGTWKDTDLAKGEHQLLNFTFRYATPLRCLGRGAEMQLRLNSRDGLNLGYLGLSRRIAKGRKDNPNYHLIWGGVKYMNRPQQYSRDYLLYPDQWTMGAAHVYLHAGYEKGYRIHHGNGLLRAELKSGGNAVLGNYATFSAESRYNLDIAKLGFKYRLFGQYGTGMLPLESALYLAGGSPEEMYDNEFYRARGFFPNSLFDNYYGQSTNHVQFGGGLNLRGYAGYQAENKDSAFSPAWYGNSGAALNMELDFDRYIPFHPKFLAKHFNLDSYLFFDGGMICKTAGKTGGIDKAVGGNLRMDAGLGFALKISEQHFLPNGPLVIRLDMPFWLNRPPYAQNFFAPRWVLGIGRAF